MLQIWLVFGASKEADMFLRRVTPFPLLYVQTFFASCTNCQLDFYLFLIEISTRMAFGVELIYRRYETRPVLYLLLLLLFPYFDESYVFAQLTGRIRVKVCFPKFVPFFFPFRRWFNATISPQSLVSYGWWCVMWSYRLSLLRKLKLSLFV